MEVVMIYNRGAVFWIKYYRSGKFVAKILLTHEILLHILPS